MTYCYFGVNIFKNCPGFFIKIHSNILIPVVQSTKRSVYCVHFAGVVKLVDTTDSKSVALKSVPVRVRPPVPNKSKT